MGLLGALHGFGRIVLIVVSVPILLVGLFFAGTAIGDDGGSVLDGAQAEDASVQDLAVGVGIGGLLILFGGTGLYRGVTGNLTGGRSSRVSDDFASGDFDGIEDAIHDGLDGDGGFGDGDGGFGGGFDGADGGDGGGGGGGDGGGGGGGGGE